MTANKNKPWFPKKRYGIGWGVPNTWQGWIVLLFYILLVIAGRYIFPTPPMQILFTILLTVLFIFICWKTGEKIT